MVDTRPRRSMTKVSAVKISRYNATDTTEWSCQAPLSWAVRRIAAAMEASQSLRKMTRRQKIANTTIRPNSVALYVLLKMPAIQCRVFRSEEHTSELQSL